MLYQDKTVIWGSDRQGSNLSSVTWAPLSLWHLTLKTNDTHLPHRNAVRMKLDNVGPGISTMLGIYMVSTQ